MRTLRAQVSYPLSGALLAQAAILAVGAVDRPGALREPPWMPRARKSGAKRVSRKVMLNVVDVLGEDAQRDQAVPLTEREPAAQMGERQARRRATNERRSLSRRGRPGRTTTERDQGGRGSRHDRVHLVDGAPGRELEAVVESASCAEPPQPASSSSAAAAASSQQHV